MIHSNSEIFTENLAIDQFWFYRCFRESSICQKELGVAFYPDFHAFVFFEIAQVYFRLDGCRVYEGHL